MWTARSERKAPELTNHLGIGNERRPGDEMISASESDGAGLRSDLSETNRFSAPDVTTKGEENGKNKVVAEPEIGNGAPNATRRIKQAELKQGAQHLRDGGKRWVESFQLFPLLCLRFQFSCTHSTALFTIIIVLLPIVQWQKGEICTRRYR